MRIRYVRLPKGNILHAQVPRLRRHAVLCPERPSQQSTWTTVAEQDTHLPPPPGEFCSICNRLLALLCRVEQAGPGGYSSVRGEGRSLRALHVAGYLRDGDYNPSHERHPRWLLVLLLLLLLLPAPAWADLGPASQHPRGPGKETVSGTHDPPPPTLPAPGPLRPGPGCAEAGAQEPCKTLGPPLRWAEEFQSEARRAPALVGLLLVFLFLLSGALVWLLALMAVDTVRSLRQGWRR